MNISNGKNWFSSSFSEIGRFADPEAVGHVPNVDRFSNPFLSDPKFKFANDGEELLTKEVNVAADIDGDKSFLPLLHGVGLGVDERLRELSGDD